jgi:hypothetical protein
LWWEGVRRTTLLCCSLLAHLPPRATPRRATPRPPPSVTHPRPSWTEFCLRVVVEERGVSKGREREGKGLARKGVRPLRGKQGAPPARTPCPSHGAPARTRAPAPTTPPPRPPPLASSTNTAITLTARRQVVAQLVHVVAVLESWREDRGRRQRVRAESCVECAAECARAAGVVDWAGTAAQRPPSPPLPDPAQPAR